MKEEDRVQYAITFRNKLRQKLEISDIGNYRIEIVHLQGFIYDLDTWWNV